MMRGLENDRSGCPRNDDRPAGQGLLSPSCGAQEVKTKIARGCGNDAPVEITKRFPQELGNLAEEREIPTFPQADSFFFQKRRT
jgi:hypothetical protein